MIKVKTHIQKNIIILFRVFLSLIKQTKFKIYTRKLHWLPLGELQQPFFFAKTKAGPHVLDSPSHLQSSLSTTPRVYLVPPPKSVRAYRHTVTWLPNFLRWIGYQIVLAIWGYVCMGFVLCHKFTCEITKLPWQHLVDTLVSMWLTLGQYSTNMWPALNWHMDRYVGQHLVDMSTDSSYLITTWLAQWESTSLLGEGLSQIQTLAGLTLRLFK